MSANPPASPSQGKPKLLDQVRAAIRLRHYSIRTEEAYTEWIKRFIVFHGKRHPEKMGAEEVGQSVKLETWKHFTIQASTPSAHASFMDG